MNITSETELFLSDVIPEILPLLNEKQKRLILGIIATEIGHGGIAFLNSLTGAARQTIVNGVAENGTPTPLTSVDFSSEKQRIQRPGGGRQQNQKMCQIGCQHPDRDAQFRYINETADSYLEACDPVISIDTKKKENIGNFKNNAVSTDLKENHVKC